MSDTTPVILFPARGCDGWLQMDAAQQSERLEMLAGQLARSWNEQGLSALVELIELRAAMKSTRAVQAAATAHDQGQAFAIQELLGIVRAALAEGRKPQ